MTIVRTVLIILAILVILYLVMNYFYVKSTTLTKLRSAKDTQLIKASTIPNNHNTNNYAYSIWFYVDDWNYRFGEPKVLLSRADTSTTPGPSIVFGAMENDITISVTCYPSAGAKNNNPVIHKCTVKNFPLQSWVNLTISLFERTLDIYIDGKLVRTCVLPGVAKVNPSTDINITPMGGFNGYTTNIQYWDTAIDPQQAYNIYRQGFGGSFLGDLFDKYRVKVSFLEDNKVHGSFEI